MKPLKPNYVVVTENDRYILIMDVGPWDQYPTVTNRVEAVVEDLAPKLAGRRLFYIDSSNNTDEIGVTDSGKFDSFIPGGPDKLT